MMRFGFFAAALVLLAGTHTLAVFSQEESASSPPGAVRADEPAEEEAPLFPSERIPAEQGDEGDAERPASDRLIRRLSELIGTEATGRETELQATIVDAVITLSAEVTHLIVDFDESRRDFPALDEELFLVPADRFDFGTVYQVVSMDVTESDLRQAPTLVNGKLPVSVGGDSPRAQLLLGSEVLDYDVYGRDREKLGRVEDVVVDLQNSAVAYLGVVSGGAFLGIGRDFRAVPMHAFSGMETARRAFYVDLDPRQWTSVAEFSDDYWPSDPAVWEPEAFRRSEEIAEEGAPSGTGESEEDTGPAGPTGGPPAAQETTP